jgi:putative transposase
MSPAERKGMINRDRTDLSLTSQCKLLKISRSSLYYTPVGVNAETLELMNEIDRVFTKYPFFGSRQIAAYLPRNGFHAGRHRVRRLMGIMPCPAGHRKAMSREGATGHIQRAKHQQEAPAAPHLPIPAEKAAYHAPEPCLVQ